jgi:hypothetical protein
VAARRQASNTYLAGRNSRCTEMDATVTAVSPKSIAVQTAALDAQNVVLDAQTSPLSGRTAGCTPVVGSVACHWPQALQFRAHWLKDHSDASNAASVTVHGMVNAVNDCLLTLTWPAANLPVPPAAVALTWVRPGMYAGSADTLAPGLGIETYSAPSADDKGFTATLIESERAAKTARSSGGGRDDSSGYGEIKGVVSSVNGQQMVLRAHMPSNCRWCCRAVP